MQTPCQRTITKRRHDYPLIWFGEVCTSIDPASNPWTDIENPLYEESPVAEDGSNMDLSFQARNELIETRKAELAEDERMFKLLLEIVSNNVQNDHFYDAYKKLKQTLINETKACQEALTARTQQRTRVIRNLLLD